MPKRPDSVLPLLDSPVVSPATTPPPRQPLLGKSRRGSAPQREKIRFWRRVWIGVQLGLVVLVIVSAVIGYFAYEKLIVYYARAEAYDLNKLDDLKVTSVFYDVNGEELGRMFEEDRILLKHDEIPDLMRKAVMAAEDRRYYQHGAIDYWGIVRALREDLLHHGKGSMQGASTIEQQLAKHLINDYSRTFDRKFVEAFVAMRLERKLSKDQILDYYMNSIYFGQGYFGVGSASRGYFGKEIKDISIAQAALLAGIIRAPNTSSPRVDPGMARRRRDFTLHQMLQEGFITADDCEEALATPVVTQRAKPSGVQSYLMAASVKELERILASEGRESAPQGLTVRTNINLHLQRAIEDQIKLKLGELESGDLHPGKSPLQASALVVDPTSGRVLAWVGGRSFAKNQYDHVSMAHRESGALIQPPLYALAFDRLGLNPASMVNASFIDPSVPPSTSDLDAMGSPLDLSKRFLAVQDALALGNKAAATRLGLRLGAPAFQDFLHRLELDVRVPEDKTGSFTPEPMTMSELTTLYQALADNGVHRHLRLIRSIDVPSRDGQGTDLLYDDSKPEAAEDRVLDPLKTRQFNLTLQNALRTGYARTLTRDYGLRSAVAGMPGYSDGYRDAWFIGYTPRLLTSVWIGYDDNRPIGSREVAANSAAPLWASIQREAAARVNSGSSFPVPAELSKVDVDRSTGALRGLAGFAPPPEDIFVYLTPAQIAAAGSAAKVNESDPSRHWSDWLNTMFSQADETELAPDQIFPQDKRADVIPPLAEFKLPALRGDILSADGTVYATMGLERNLVLTWPAVDPVAGDQNIPQLMRNRLDEVEKILGLKIDLTDAEWLNQYRTQRYQPFLVAEDLTPFQIDRVTKAGLLTQGFGLQSAPRRSYPRGAELAHVLGYLSRDQKRNRGKYLAGDVIYDRYKGASGLEQLYDKDLVGQDGSFLVSTTPDGYARSGAVTQSATAGHDVRLTINAKIQGLAEQALNLRKRGAVVVMDVHNGDIVAFASHPTFDPNLFVPAISADEWNLLNTDEANPLLCRAYQAQYPPGSTFKTVTSIAAMRAGVFDPNWVVHCTGYFDLGDVHMKLPDEHGDVSFLDGFTFSYNTYFMNLGLKVGRDILLDTARSFNLGQPTHFGLPNEMAGLIPDNEFFKRVHGREMSVGDVPNVSIGQGDILVTPIQMATLMGAVANDGTVYQPRLVKQVEQGGTALKVFPTSILRTIAFDEKWMPELKKAMQNVTVEGTAHLYVHLDGVPIAAKTGTAQVGSKEHRRQIAWLCGFLPADDPQYSFAVMIEGTFADNHGNGLEDGLLGGKTAGPVAQQIFAGIYGQPKEKVEGGADEEAETSTKTKTVDIPVPNAAAHPAKPAVKTPPADEP